MQPLGPLLRKRGMTNSLTPRLAAAAAALAVLLTGCAQVAPTGAVPAQTGSPIPSTSPSTATTPASTTSTPTRTPSTLRRSGIRSKN